MARGNKLIRWPAMTSAGFCLLVLVAIMWGYIFPIPSQNGNAPLRSYIFRLAPGTRDLFFARMCLYAEVHGFSIHIGASDPYGHGYNVVMQRTDLQVIGANPWDDASFDLGFHANPGVDLPDAVLDTLVEDLKRSIEQIPGSKTLKTLQDH